MKIGIIGAGAVASGLVARLRPQGHEFMLSFTRDAAALASLGETLGVATGTPAEAVAFADVVALAAPWGAVPAAIPAAGDLTGRTLWDCTLPLLPDLSGLAVGTTDSGAETVARLAPGARVVKGIPPFADAMQSGAMAIAGEPPGLFVAGDDAEAKAAVAALLTALPALVTDAGPLSAARAVEPAMLLLVQLAYLRGFGSRVTLRLARD